MKKRVIPALLLASMLIVPASAENEENASSEIDFSQYSLEQLLVMRDSINEEIENKGYIVYYDLTRGSTGEDVSRLQERLTELGYYEGKISGKYDTETQKAVKQFKKANGLGSDANATREDQVVLYSEDAIAKEVPVEEEKTPATPKPTISPELAEYTTVDYIECSRYPEQYIGQKVLLTGKVVQVLGDRKTGFTVRLATSGGYDDIYYIEVKKDPGFNILEDDRLNVYAVLTGRETYTTIFNASVTIPSARADYIELK